MRVFEFFNYNLKNIRFKENKDYIDSLLCKLGIEYTDIGFCFWGDDNGELCDKAIKYFPSLTEYKQYEEPSKYYPGSSEKRCFSSMCDLGEEGVSLCVKKEQKDSVASLIKKIPNPINFPFMGVLLDNVNWYGAECENQKPAFTRNKYGFQDHEFSSYFSNSIRFFKEFDFGNKYNPISLVIERLSDGDDLVPHPSTFAEVVNMLEKPVSRYFKCYFTDEERKHLEDMKGRVSAFIAIKKELYRFSLPEIETEPINNLEDYITPVSGFSPKAAFSKAARKFGYKYISYSHGQYIYRKADENNHTFEVEFLNIPLSVIFEASVGARGFNFSHTLFSAERVTLDEVSKAELFAEKVFEAADKMEKACGEELLSAYGKTPKWFEF